MFARTTYQVVAASDDVWSSVCKFERSGIESYMHNMAIDQISERRPTLQIEANIAR